MQTKPKAVESFDIEKDGSDEAASMYMEHPIDRLKYHIMLTKGKIIKSEFSVDGLAYVIWEAEGRQYRAWSSWPDADYKVDWKLVK